MLTASNETLTFRTPWPTRTKHVVYGTFFAGSGLALSSFAAWMVYIVLSAEFSVPPVLAIVPALIAWILVMRLTSKIVFAPLRFCIVVGRDTVDVGWGWLKCRFRFGNVEAISLPNERGEHGVGLEGDGQAAFVLLRPYDEQECARLLRQLCVNAIFVDQSGKEHLIPEPDRPVFTLSALYRRTVSRAWGSSFSALFLFALSCIMIPGICVDLLGRGPKLPMAAFEFNCEICAGATLGFVATGSYAVRNWRKVHMISEKLSALRLQAGVPSDG